MIYFRLAHVNLLLLPHRRYPTHQLNIFSNGRKIGLNATVTMNQQTLCENKQTKNLFLSQHEQNGYVLMSRRMCF